MNLQFHLPARSSHNQNCQGIIPSLTPASLQSTSNDVPRERMMSVWTDWDEYLGQVDILQLSDESVDVVGIRLGHTSSRRITSQRGLGV